MGVGLISGMPGDVCPIDDCRRKGRLTKICMHEYHTHRCRAVTRLWTLRAPGPPWLSTSERICGS